MSMEDAVADISSKAWFLIQHRFDMADLPLRYYRDFRNRIRGVVACYLKGYSLCGVSDICNDPVTKLPWVHQMPSLAGTIRMLELPAGFDEFVEELAVHSLQPIRHAGVAESDDDLLSTLHLAYNSILGEYVSMNPYCGRTSICRFSEPVNPWKNELFRSVQDISSHTEMK
jgi:hypothetical protein